MEINDKIILLINENHSRFQESIRSKILFFSLFLEIAEFYFFKKISFFVSVFLTNLRRQSPETKEAFHSIIVDRDLFRTSLPSLHIVHDNTNDYKNFDGRYPCY